MTVRELQVRAASVAVGRLLVLFRGIEAPIPQTVHPAVPEGNHLTGTDNHVEVFG